VVPNAKTTNRHSATKKSTIRHVHGRSGCRRLSLSLGLGADCGHSDRDGRRLRPCRRVCARSVCGRCRPMARLWLPELPRAWIIQTARHKAIDRIRRNATFEEKLESYSASELVRTVEEPDYDTSEIPDDRLRLIFTCCRPALALEAQVALTLRTLCGPGDGRDCAGISRA